MRDPPALRAAMAKPRAPLSLRAGSHPEESSQGSVLTHNLGAVPGQAKQGERVGTDRPAVGLRPPWLDGLRLKTRLKNRLKNRLDT